MTACDAYVSVNAQCARTPLDWCQRCFCALVYPRSSCHVNKTRHLSWSHGWWKMVPTDTKVYINTRSSYFSQAIEIHTYCERRLVVYWVGLRCSEPSSIPGDSSERFSVSFLKMEFVTEKFISWLKNSEYGKIWNSHFQNFKKINLIILANRSNRSNRQKSLNRLDRLIGQRINSRKGPAVPKRHQQKMYRKSLYIFQTHEDARGPYVINFPHLLLW